MFFVKNSQITVLFLCMTALNYIPESPFKKRLYRRTILACFQLLTRWLGCALKFHDTKYKPQNGIAVSNHTTPFDVLVLNSDNCYAMVSNEKKLLYSIRSIIRINYMELSRPFSPERDKRQNEPHFLF